MEPILLIVFLPLLAAIIGGLGNRALGNVPVKLLTTGALFAACALSWPIFLSFVGGHAVPHVVPVLQWVPLVWPWQRPQLVAQPWPPVRHRPPVVRKP